MVIILFNVAMISNEMTTLHTKNAIDPVKFGHSSFFLEYEKRTYLATKLIHVCFDTCCSLVAPLFPVIPSHKHSIQW